MEDPMRNNYLINEQAAARHLGFSKRFLQARRLKGEGPQFVRISKRAVRYRIKDLEKWVEDRIRKNNND